MTLMRTHFLPAMLLTISSALCVAAQEPVLIAGGSTPPTAVMGSMVSPPAIQPAAYPVAVVYQQPVVYVPAVPAVAGGVCSPPNVIYFGGPNSCYSIGHGSYYRPNCAYSPSVIYFGRGEAYQRGYAFRHPR
jgi:hypothetical protein